MSAGREEGFEIDRERVGPYRLMDMVGHGGMGVVYRAVGPGGEEVALKLLSTSPLRRRAETARFQREARIRIGHPGVVKVLDAGVDDGLPWIAFELLDGESLQQRLARGPMSIREAVEVAAAVAAGLEAAHEAHVIHRDLKPSNVFLCRGAGAKVIDFGIARLGAAETQLTVTGNVLGTPTYLSPEQAQGQRALDARTDVWSLGICLYEMLAGRSPFERPTALATVLAVMIEAPPPLGILVPAVPPSLAALAHRCLEKEPDDRFPTMAALREALEVVDVTDAMGETHVCAQGSADTSPALSVHGASITPGEERVVAVLLADRVLDAGDLARAVEGAGGRLLRVLGDRAIGLFGGETWEGDEVQRAAGAALEARRAARWLAVASGRASFSGATGIAGSALAAAEAGTRAQLAGVALDAVAARVLAGHHAVRQIEGDLYELVERSSGVSQTFAPPPMRSATIGRDAELAQMRAAFEAVRLEGRAAAVLVHGPPGIGKSHLRWEMGRMVDAEGDPLIVLAARAEAGRRPTAFSLWASALAARARDVSRGGGPALDRQAQDLDRQDAVRALVAEAIDPGPESEECVEFFAELLGVPWGPSRTLDAARRDPPLMRDRLRLALEDWIAGATLRAPVVLLFEDLQWADDASLSLLQDLPEILADAPLLVFATARSELLEARPELLGVAGSTRISLRGLSAPQVGRLAEGIAGRPLLGDVVRELASRTAGNPLFVEQIVAALREEGRLEEDEDAEDLPLPLTVEAAVQSRLDHLPPKEKDLCKRASVFDRTFTPQDLEALGVFDPRPILTSLSRRELLMGRARDRGSSEREYLFRSSLVRDVAYRLVAPSLREDLHLRVASRLAGLEAEPEETAFHFERASRRDDAAAWYARAAAAASRRADAPGVLRCARRALDLGAPPESLFGLHMACSDAHDALGDLDSQAVSLEAALEAADGELERARVLIDRAVWSWRAGDPARALAMAEDAVETARKAADVPTVAMARGRQGAILIYAGMLDEAQRALNEASRLARTAEGSLRASVATWRAQLATARGDLGARRDGYREAVALYQETGDLRRAAGAEMNLADAYNRVGAFREAERALRDCLEKVQRLGNRIAEGYACLNLGYALAMQGRGGEALACLDEAERVSRAAGERRLAVAVHVYRVRALIGEDPAMAVTEAELAVAAAEHLGVEGLSVMAAIAQGRAAYAAGALDAALAATARAMELRDALGSVEEDEAELFLVHAQVLEALGRAEEARAVRDRGRARLRELAGHIADPEWRERFLREVPAHRALLEA